jgi:hypothetical protein
VTFLCPYRTVYLFPVTFLIRRHKQEYIFQPRFASCHHIGNGGKPQEAFRAAMYRPGHSVNHSSGSKLTTPGLYRAFFIGYAHPAVDSSDVGVLSTVRRSRRGNVTVDHRRISKRLLDALHDRKIAGYLYQLWCLPYISNNNQLAWALPRISAAANRRLGLYSAISVIATRFERSRDRPLVSVHAGIGPLSRHAYTMTSTIQINERGPRT